MNAASFAVATAEDTRALGGRLARALLGLPRDAATLVGLSGDLGAGKTTLVSGMLQALGHVGPVRSPTYALIEPYRYADRDIVHCDLYRLDDPLQLEELGFRDYLVPAALVLVEWPERGGAELGQVDLALELVYRKGGREVRIKPHTARGEQALLALLSAA